MKCSFEHAIANEVLEVYRAYFGSIAKFMQCVVSNITFPTLEALRSSTLLCIMQSSEALGHVRIRSYRRAKQTLQKTAYTTPLALAR